MAWGDLTSTQWVSFTNIQGAGFILKPSQSPVTSNEWMTKAEATAKYYLDEANIYLAPKASNQWVAKRDLTAGTTTTTTTTLAPISIQISSSYDGGTGLTIEILVNIALPQSLTLYFEWCTDSGADGSVTFSLPSTFSGSTTALANLSSTGAFSGTYASGNVDTSSPSTVNAMYVKGLTIVLTTSDTSRQYLVSYLNIDNSCSGTPTPVADECFKNC